MYDETRQMSKLKLPIWEYTKEKNKVECQPPVAICFVFIDLDFFLRSNIYFYNKTFLISKKK